MELIGDGTSYPEWLEGPWLLHATTASKLGRRFGAAALVRRLNHLLARPKCYPEMVITKNGIQVTERWRIDSAEELIAVVAAQIGLLFATEQPALVKRCAGPGCTLWFVDRTKAHSRLFCSATVCGNRAKVAAFRERQRGTAD